jgi:hypothetical protein
MLQRNNQKEGIMPTKETLRENRALEFEALAIEAQAISIEVQGMRFENEQRIILGQGMAYQEVSFLNKVYELRAIARKLRDLGK